MTIEKSKVLLKKAKTFIGQQVDINILDISTEKYNSTTYKFIDTEYITWTVKGLNPTVDLWAKLKTIDGTKYIKIELEKIVNYFEGKQIEKKEIRYKTVPLTHNAITHPVYVGAVPAHNKKTGQNGFLACTFKVADGKPTDKKKGNELINILYDTEKEAISEGTKILKIQHRQNIQLSKKRK